MRRNSLFIIIIIFIISGCGMVSNNSGTNTSTSKNILNFVIYNNINTDVGVISDNVIIVEMVPPVTNFSAFAPQITHNGASISPNSGVTLDFTSTVNYVVLAEDGSTKDYFVKLKEKTYVVGDVGPSEGWIFYDNGSYSSGWRYLEVSPSDQSSENVYSNIINVVASANGSAIGTGYDNTVAIINQPGHASSSALSCDTATINSYVDWFLPSQGELSQIYTALNSDTISMVYDNTNTIRYWSSTESGASNGYCRTFKQPGQSGAYVGKSAIYRVRAIRRF